MDNIKRQQTERIDTVEPIRSMSYNIPGNEDRIKAHCERIQEEYFNKGLNPAITTNIEKG